MTSRLQQLFGVVFFLAALIAVVALFVFVFYPQPYEGGLKIPQREANKQMMDAVSPKLVSERLAQIESCGSRSAGQEGLSRCEDLIKSIYKKAGLEVFEQDVEFANVLTDNGCGVLRLEGGSSAEQTIWPLSPNYAQPVVTPASGVSGELFLVTENSMEKALRFDDKIAVIDLSESLPQGFDVVPSVYADLGFRAIVYTHTRGITNIAPVDLVRTFFEKIPANVVRVVAEPQILSSIGRTGVISVNSRWTNTKSRNIVGVLKAPNASADSAVVIPVYYDARSSIPDLAPGYHQALQTAIQLQILEGLLSNKESFRRDVIFVAVTGCFSFQLGSARLMSTVGREGESDVARIRIEAKTAENQKQIELINEILSLFEGTDFAVPKSRKESASAVDRLSAGARRLFLDQFNYMVRLRVFNYAETLLQAEIAFKRNPDDLQSAEYKKFRAVKIEFDRLNTLSALSFPLYLERTIEGDGGFILDAEELKIDPNGVSTLRDAMLARFKHLADFHRQRKASLEQDASLFKLFSHYRKLIVIAPELNPSAQTPEQETIAYTSGDLVAHGAAAQSFNRVLEDAVFVLGLQGTFSIRQPARMSSFCPQLSQHANRLAATPWAGLSHPAFSVISPTTSYAYAPHIPFKSASMENLDSIAASMRVIGETVLSCANGYGVFRKLPIERPWGYRGNAYAAGVGNSIVPNFPLSGALITGINKPCLITDPYGRFETEYLTHPMLYIWARYLPLEAFCFDQDGYINYVKDRGDAAQLIYKTTRTSLELPNNLILYRSAPVTIFDYVNPQSMKDFTGMSFIAKKGLTAFTSRSPFLDKAGIMDFIEPNERFFVTLKAGSLDNELVSVIRSFCLATTQTNDPSFKPDPDNEIDGPGYLAQETPVLHNVAREASASMEYLADKRLALQKQYGMADDMTLLYHQKGVDLALRASAEDMPALEKRRTFRESLAYFILNHPVIHKSISDAVWGILWYMFLLVPFIFFFEKLVFGFTDIRKQILAQGIIFLVIFFLLRLLHPAFQIVRSSLMILLGFVIILIAGSATVLLSAKFQENIDALRKAQGALKNVEGNKMGMMTTAFMLGLNNMHRRKVRTGLTCASLVLMTFVMICFSSVHSDIVSKNRAVGRACYQGMLFRERRFIPVTDGEISALKARFGHKYIISVRKIMPGTYNPLNQKSVSASLDVVCGSGDKAATRVAKAAILLDPTEPLAGTIKMLTSNGWFTAAQQSEKAGAHPVLLPDEMAERLGISVQDVNEGEAKVTIDGSDFYVYGIFDSKSFVSVCDVDGQNLLPFDIEALVLPRVMGANIVLAEESDPRVSPEDVIIALNGHLEPTEVSGIRTVSTVVDMKNAGYPEVRFDIDSYIEQTSCETYYGLDGVSYYARRVRVRSLAGLMDLIIPLIIAALTVLNTMKGSVYERRGEVFVYNAVGIAPRHIFFIFVAESLVYAVVGVVLGYVLAQGVGRVLIALNMTGGLNMNFTSLSTVYASLAIAGATILSTWFPARSAMDIAKPTEDAGWSMPKTEGDDLSFDLPFTFGHRDRIAVLGFFHIYFVNHGEGSAGPFFAGKPELCLADSEASSDKEIAPMLGVTVWCKPFDLGVSQRIEIHLETDPKTGEYISSMKMKRLTGTHDAWQRLNGALVSRIRRHFLHWRAATEDMKQDFYESAKALLEIGIEAVPKER